MTFGPTVEEMRERGRNGGIASGKVRRGEKLTVNMGSSAEAKEARAELVTETKDRLKDLLPRAFEVLESNLDLIEEHPKIAQDAALAIVAYVLGKPGQELTLKGDAAPPAFLWNHPAVQMAATLAAELEAHPEQPPAPLALPPAPSEPD